MASTKNGSNGEAKAPTQIHHIRIDNWLGIEALEVDVPPAGVVIAGRNGSGKTSVLRAIQAALDAKGVSPAAIRVGASKAEILLDLGDVTVRRAITPKGSSLQVRTADGFTPPSQQTYLRELFSAPALDPLAFWAEKDPKKRRAQLLEALPIRVTPAQLRAWGDGAITDEDLARLAGGPFAEEEALAGHGLEVVERAHKLAYDRRAAANRTKKELVQTAAADLAEGQRMAKELGDAPGPALPEAMAELDAVRAKEAEIAAARRLAAEGEAKRAKVQAEVAALRDRAARGREALPLPVPAETMTAARNVYETACQAAVDLARTVGDLEEQLARARAAAAGAQAEETRAGRHLEHLRQVDATRIAGLAAAQLLDEQAAHLEELVGAEAAGPPPDAEQLIATRKDEAVRAVERARLREQLATQRQKFAASKARAAEAEKLADALDLAVTALATKAPAELLASTAVGGVTIDGDTIKLNGVALDQLSGAEQMKFALELAKAVSGGAGGFLLVDRLESVDPEARPAFLAAATEGGWQLIAALADRGDRVIEPIQPASEASP